MEFQKAILQQRGGNKFLAMTGAKNLIADGNALTMHLRPNRAKAKYLRIELNKLDLYNVTFRKHDAACTFPVVAEFENVGCEALQSIFTKVTGFDTHL